MCQTPPSKKICFFFVCNGTTCPVETDKVTLAAGVPHAFRHALAGRCRSWLLPVVPTSSATIESLTFAAKFL